MNIKTTKSVSFKELFVIAAAVAAILALPQNVKDGDEYNQCLNGTAHSGIDCEKLLADEDSKVFGGMR